MTEVERDLCLVLLKLLREQDYISEPIYLSCCSSRFLCAADKSDADSGAPRKEARTDDEP